MNRSLTYVDIKIEQLTIDLLNNFSRHQESKQVWKKDNGQWILKDADYIRDSWNQEEKENFILPLLRKTLNGNGFVLGAFLDGNLIGLVSLENKPFGSENQYLHFNGLWVTLEQRGKGIGRKLFEIARKKAVKTGCKKLYICANPTKETIAFYMKMGCVEAKEINDELLKEEPDAFHMEFFLKDI